MKPKKDSELKKEAKRSSGARAAERSKKQHQAQAKSAGKAYTAAWTKVYNRLKTANNRVKKVYDAAEKKKRNKTRASKLRKQLASLSY